MGLLEMNIVMFEIEALEESQYHCLTPHNPIRFTPSPLNLANSESFSDAEIISTAGNSKLSAETLGHFAKLRLIATRSTGFDHIDIGYCQTAGVSICNVPDYGDPTVAEYAFALLLALSRKIPEAVGRARRGDFSQAGLRGFDLDGKVMGVVGVGRIGRRVIQIAKGFGMTVLGFDAHPDKALEMELGMRFVSLDQMLIACDVLSLHVPGGAGTSGLISAEKLALMKSSAVLINAARGDVIDAEALIQALVENRIGGAALDVFSQEPWLRDEAEIFGSDLKPGLAEFRTLAADHALLASPKVLASAHVAYDTKEAVVRIHDCTVANILAFEAGQPRNLVGVTSLAATGRGS
jgi:D-lactate dehydrogenase